MRVWFIPFTLILTSLAACLFWNCGPGDRLAGGSEIGNPAGIVVDKNGHGKPGVVLRLLPSDFNPLQAGAIPDSLTSITDESGAYHFNKVGRGRYTLTGLETATGMRFRSDLEVSWTNAAPSRDTLRTPGVVIVEIPDTALHTSYCYLPGTPFFSRVDVTGRAVFESLPPGPTQIDFASLPNDSISLPTLKFAAVNVLAGGEVKASLLGSTATPHRAYQAVAGADLQQSVDSLQPGDTLYLRGGVHELANLVLSGQGRADAWRVIRNFPGETAILRGTSGNNNLIDIVGGQYWQIQGLEIDSTPDGSDAIKFAQQSVSHHIVIRDLHIHHIRGIGINGQGNHHHIAVEHNQIDHLYGNPATGIRIGEIGGTMTPSHWSVARNWIHHIGFDAMGGNGINVFLGASAIQINDNQVHDNAILGIRVFGMSGTATEEGLVSLEGNAIWNCGEALSVYSDATVRNNVVFACSLPFSSYVYNDGSTAGNPPRNLRVYNNTFLGGDSLDLESWDSSRTCLFANNAVYKVSFGLRLRGSGSIYGNVGDVTATGFSPGSSAKDLLDPANQDFSPALGGGLINRAIPPMIPVFDFSGRIRDSLPDVGALEYSGASTTNRILAGFK